MQQSREKARSAGTGRKPKEEEEDDDDESRIALRVFRAKVLGSNDAVRNRYLKPERLSHGPYSSRR
jgi:hypothetical protein